MTARDSRERRALLYWIEEAFCSEVLVAWLQRNSTDPTVWEFILIARAWQEGYVAGYDRGADMQARGSTAATISRSAKARMRKQRKAGRKAARL